MKTIKRQSPFLVTVVAVVVSILCFYACQKEPAGKDVPSQETLITEGKFKKVIEASDASGRNKVLLEVSANSEAVLGMFDDNTFSALPHRDLPASPDDNGAPKDLVNEEPSAEPAYIAATPMTDQNTYVVKVLSKSLEEGVQGVELNYSEAFVEARDCQTFFGFFTNNTSTVGAINNSIYCNKTIGFRYYYFNQGQPVSFHDNQPWRSLFSKKAGCFPNGSILASTVLANNCSLSIYKSSNAAGNISFNTMHVFKHLGGWNVGLLVSNGACTGNGFGIFIFI